ncbi:TetR/AcrR family transcriptional regulator [Streptacidiphilus sp. ASG 303]|uniref:TetR/AcrR family transcriptional regulator n=1 Tax=Streptacidiphilus sp. ASG 303 TaxID=2896847 RepID=UPI001E529DE7|nr:TetR/AcrR family transcriptional regulator [Streptacidiphilus sp. ASG 303]MCD0483848.1 TetR/AcrR family transcriptional regulator [Streptacidiphilus sp. ASG 303]
MATRTRPRSTPAAPERPDRGPRRRLSVDERREQLIEVALDLFSRCAPDEVSIDDIAAAAGASRPLVYHYFPGKQSLYEAALRRAADELAGRFREPAEGPLSERLHRVMVRYFDFVDGHGPGFAALLRGGSVAAGSWSGAVIDEVRRAAHDEILAHLGAEDPGPRLRLTVRTWIADAEITALAWLEDRSLSREELQLRLVQEFTAALAVTASREPSLVPVLRGLLAEESPSGPAGRLLAQLGGLLADPGIADAVGRLAAEG